MKTTATEKYNKPYTEVVKILDKGFSDMKKGQKMLISSPKSIAAYIQKIPRGEQRTIKQIKPLRDPCLSVISRDWFLGIQPKIILKTCLHPIQSPCNAF